MGTCSLTGSSENQQMLAPCLEHLQHALVIGHDDPPACSMARTAVEKDVRLASFALTFVSPSRGQKERQA